MSEINVTPFVDVMLVLLIVFMVAAPLLTAGVPVDLPKPQAKPLAPRRSRSPSRSAPTGKIFIREDEVAIDELVPQAHGDRRATASRSASMSAATRPRATARSCG